MPSRLSLPSLPLAALVTLTVIGGCSTRAPRPSAVSHTPPSPSQQLDRGREAQRLGQHAQALALYAAAASSDVPVEVRREALLAQGLLNLDPSLSSYDIDGAYGLLDAARALYETPPADLVTALALARELQSLSTEVTTLQQRIATLEEAQAGRDGVAKTAQTRAGALEQENRTLKRTVRQLKLDLEQREAALRKAADAVIGAPRPR